MSAYVNTHTHTHHIRDVIINVTDDDNTVSAASIDAGHVTVRERTLKSNKEIRVIHAPKNMHTRTRTRSRIGESSGCWEGADLCREPSAVRLLLLGDWERMLQKIVVESGENIWY